MKKKNIILLSFLLGIIFLIVILGVSDKKVYFSLNGSEVQEVNIGEKYKDTGVDAKYCNKYFKIFCKNINNKVVVTTRKKDKKEFINYVLKYKNEKSILTREIIYVDKESPTIELINSNETVCPNKDYVEEGYKATDNVDGDITDKVLINKIDDKIYYTVEDSSGNKRVVFRTVNYKDDEKPVINLNGGDISYSFINQEYKDKGFNAYDNCDGDVTKNVIVENNVDITKVGEYAVNYTVVDSGQNKTSVSRKVVVYDDASKIPKNGKVVYLTFDDGPYSYTESILNVLNKYNVKATFFVTNQFSNYQDLIKKEYLSGHSIGVHTFTHNYGKIYESVDSYVNDFDNMNKIIYDETGFYSKLYRFPGGSSNTISRFNKGIVTKIANKMNELGYVYYDWNVDSNDTGTSDPEEIYNNVIKAIEKKDYSVVLMHDIKKANIISVDKIISYGLENGYTFLPIDENSPIVHHKINN